MLKREKLLLYLILVLQKQGKLVTKTFLDKLLFLARKESNVCELVKFYNFYPHKYGPFSNNFYRDFADLESRGLLDGDFQLSDKGIALAETVGKAEKEVMVGVASRFSDTQSVVNYVYTTYPEYTVKSELSAAKKEFKGAGVFSIGYEGKDIDSFLDALIQNGVEVLVDVRANPFSMNFSFTKNKLANSLENVGIGYLHVPELGIEGQHRQNLGNEADYKQLFEFYRKQILPKSMDKVRMLCELGGKKRIALMCFECDKAQCHRGVLSEALEESGIRVTHL